MAIIHRNGEKRRRTFLALTFSLISGYVNILGLLAIGSVFLSFMSGNSMRLGYHIFNNDWYLVFQYLIIICSFIFGAFLGDLIKSKLDYDELFIVLFSEIILFLLALILSFTSFNETWLQFALLAIAMGIQNTAQITINDATIGKSFVSGVLYNLGVAFSKMLQKQTDWRPAFLLFISWGCFVIGGFLGTITITFFSIKQALLILLLLLVSLLILLLFLSHRDLQKNKIIVKSVKE
jgi:Predicted membrane protein